jgi:molybdopterin-guanine dinucleotide biosynthesis protein A
MGRDKAGLLIDGEPMIARTVRILSGVAAPLVVVAAAEQAFSLPASVEIVRDDTPYEGPLAAFARGLAQVSERASSVFLCGTDHPRLSAAVVTRLIELARGRDAAVAVIDGRRQLLCAAYAVHVRPVAERLLASGERSMKALAAAIGTREVTPAELLDDAEVREEDAALASFVDVDTPKDLERC